MRVKARSTGTYCDGTFKRGYCGIFPKRYYRVRFYNSRLLLLFGNIYYCGGYGVQKNTPDTYSKPCGCTWNSSRVYVLGIKKEKRKHFSNEIGNADEILLRKMKSLRDEIQTAFG